MTAQTPNVLQQAILLILTPQCYDTYFVNFDFFHAACFSQTLSKCLGLAIIMGSLLVKVPQILKLYRGKSGEGISMISVTLDLAAVTIYSSYSFIKQFPFSSWGDASCLVVQTVIIAVLVIYYEGSTFNAVVYLVCYLCISVSLISGYVPLIVLWFLQGCNIGIVVTSKLTQAYINWKNGHTGQLSAITLFMLFFGSAARIFTSIQETGDRIVILTFIAGTVCNGLLVSQLLYYWNVMPKKQKTVKFD